MKKSPIDKLAHKRTLLVERTARALGLSIADAETALALGRRQSFRLRGDASVLDELGEIGWEGEQCQWYADGYSIRSDKRAVADSAAAQRGDVYVQNAASWLSPLVLAPQPGDRILDVCAAPGGKAAHLYDLAEGKCELWVNDNARPRLAKLRANFDRLGVDGYHESMYDATRLASRLPHESFDRILLDAPCSGEGMLDISKPKEFTYWSPAQIKRLAHLQKQLLSESWKLLRSGGTLVYSTCTIAPEENEAVIDYALRHCEGARLEPIEVAVPNRVDVVSHWGDREYTEAISRCMRLAPSEYVEAFFVAKLVKTDEDVSSSDLAQSLYNF